MSSVQIGKQIGGRNNATVIHSINQIKNLIDVDDQVRNEIVLVEERVKFRRV
jgi:chromosomal replication initiation ATPase DnaA